MPKKGDSKPKAEAVSCYLFIIMIWKYVQTFKYIIILMYMCEFLQKGTEEKKVEAKPDAKKDSKKKWAPLSKPANAWWGCRRPRVIPDEQDDDIVHHYCQFWPLFSSYLISALVIPSAKKIQFNFNNTFQVLSQLSSNFLFYYEKKKVFCVFWHMTCSMRIFYNLMTYNKKDA